MGGTADLIKLVILLPLIGFFVQAFVGKAVVNKLGAAKGKRFMGGLAVLFVAVPFVLGAIITAALAKMGHVERSVVVQGFDWINIAGLNIPFEFIVDPLSMTMVLVITGIGALIHLYATGYMAEEKDYTRFFTYLNLFIVAMLLLVCGNNLVLMFIGWEGVGLCSYLLIGFWYKDIANAKAANKAFIVNRIGDWGFMLGMFGLIALLAGNASALGTEDQRWLSYDVIFPAIIDILRQNPGWATIIALLLFVGAMGKSAQFPLYFWLPDAMAGPTPVSALIHAATMVTAGVVMLNRMHPIFEMSTVAMGVVACIGAFTALFAALVAFGQTDIKKVLAYSTVSQLGFMFVACGVGAFWVGMFHVITHAFFKALLFLGSGAVIHAMAHEQDMRKYGNLLKYIKITSWTMIIGWLAIAGFPLLSGFWSKEAILGNALGNSVAYFGDTNVGIIAGWILLIVAVLTAAYMTRLTFLTFGFPGVSNEERWRAIPAHAEHHDDHAHDHHEEHAHDHGPDVHGFFFTDEERAAHPEEHEHHHALDKDHNPHEVPPSMWIPLAVLAVLSIGGGWILHNNHLLQHWLYPEGLSTLSPEVVGGHPGGWVGNWLMVMGIGAGFAGIIYGFIVYRKGLPKRENEEKDWDDFRTQAGNQFGYDKFVMEAGTEGGATVASWFYKAFDKGFIDGIVHGLAFISTQIGRGLRMFQTGYARMYALMMLAGAVGLLVYFALIAQRLSGGGN
ncbi:MAG: NADH-quinone oxidoreductase subunit L [Fimbriimonadaceae bacterium]|nr:NADH-quinone oxidoreductase subunit L [Fimbriimonadaceae bacterium]